MIHWCIEEQMMLMAAIGAIPFVGIKLKMWYAKWMKSRKPHCCDKTHGA